MTAFGQKTEIIILFLLAVLISSCNSRNRKNGEAEKKYVKKINEWHRERVSSLTEKDSWLSLVGLYWLDNGGNTFGSDSTNDLVFPRKVPDRIGSFILNNGKVHISVKRGIEVLDDEGKAIRNRLIYSDSDTNTTILSLGSLHWYIIKRGNRFAVRLKDENSDALVNFKGIRRFPVSPDWRLRARFQPYDSVKTVTVPNVMGKAYHLPSPGTLQFHKGGKTYRLQALSEEGTDQFFIVFGDRTNGEETYGGGRFVYIDKPGDSNYTHIDFNKAYNPPCAFTAYATCPLPPEQNRLTLEVTAGEKNYGRQHSH